MTTRASMVRRLATAIVAVTALGLSGIAAASTHSGGGGGGGSHGGGGGGGGGHAAAHVGHAPSFSGMHGGFHAPAGNYRAPSVGWRGPAQVAHGWSGGSTPARAITGTRAITASHGHAPWGRPGWGSGYYGRGYYPYHPYYSFVGWLPPYYATFWWGGIPYYFADSTYYLWDANVGQYQVVPPPGADESANAAAAEELYAYPNAGQSEEQQSTDRYECHRWAADQSGFDPTQANGGVSPESAAQARDAYRRADTACLAGRGYTVQ